MSGRVSFPECRVTGVSLGLACNDLGASDLELIGRS